MKSQIRRRTGFSIERSTAEIFAVKAELPVCLAMGRKLDSTGNCIFPAFKRSSEYKRAMYLCAYAIVRRL